MKKKSDSVVMLAFMLVSLLTLTFATRTAQASPETTIYVNPELSIASPGESFTVTIDISEAVNLFSYETKLGYDPNILEVTSVVEGPFIKDQTTSPLGTLFSTILGADYVYAVCVTMGKYPGVSGSGTLFNVTFNVLDEGESDLDLYDSTLLDDTGALVSHDAVDGYFSTAIVLLTATVNINPDTLNLRSRGRWITAYIELPEGYNAEDIVISSIMLEDSIPAETNPKYGFVKNPEIEDRDINGIPELMVKFNRTELTSYIYHVLGIKLGDVTLTVTGQLSDGTPFEGTDTIKAVFAGDINGNKVIDVIDVSLLARSYGAMREEEAYDEIIDLNSDGIIEMRDLVAAAMNLGEAVP